MSSGTQIDLNWAGLDAPHGAAPAPPATVPDATGFSAGKSLSDEEILGIEPVGTVRSPNRYVIPSEARNPSSIGDSGDASAQRDSSGKSGPRNDNEKMIAAGEASAASMPEWMQAAATDPAHGAEAQRLWQEHQAFRAAFSSPKEAHAIKELFPGGAQEAQALKQASQSVDRIDAAIFSGDARAQSEVVAEMARANPAAFRTMFAEAAKLLAGFDAGGPRQEKTDSSVGPAAQALPRNDAVEMTATQPGSFDPAAFASFERSTNETVARDVRASIGDTLARVLPDGVAEGASRRIGEDIFNEVHRTLAADEALSKQVGAVLRDRRFGPVEQQRVASLLAGRAKQLVPGVARRVIGEWTSSVLGTARTKAARQSAAESRVDIAAPGGSLDSMPLRAMSRREVDYASMSDDEILAL
jgi:hypothetical protein